jgi:hypothetical protein
MRRTGFLAGLVAGPFFLASVGLNTWVSLNYLFSLGWQFVCAARRCRGRARWRAGRTGGRRLPPL